MSPRDGRGFNCYFPMPFNRDARVELTNEGDRRLVVYFYIDYETFERPLENVGLFHAQWRSEYPTVGWGDDDRRFEDEQDYRREAFSTPNMSGEDNLRDSRGGGARAVRRVQPECRLPAAPQERLVRRGRRHDLHRRGCQADPPWDGHGRLLQYRLESAN